MESPSTYVTAGWMVERAAPGGPAPKLAAARAGEVKDGRSPPPWAVRAQRASLTAPSTTLSVCENAAASRWSIGAREIACSVLIGGDVRRAYEPLPSLSLFDGASAITPGRHRFPFHPTSLYACWEGNRGTHRFPCPRSDARPPDANPRVLWHDRRDFTKLADSFTAFVASLEPLQ